MTNSSDPKATNPGTSSRRGSDQWVAMQLIITVTTFFFAIFGFQWQIGNLINAMTVKFTRSELQIEELKTDVAELKATIKELSGQIGSEKSRSPYHLRSPKNDDY